MSDQKVWKKDDLLEICRTYMATQPQPLNIILSEPQNIFYKQSDEQGTIVSELCIRIYGEIANRLNYNLTDEEVVEKLIHFFTHVGNVLSQHSVRFSYQSNSYRISL